MAETLFAFDESNYRDCQNRFRGDRNQEYYVGDLTIEDGSIIDIRADRKAVGPVSIIRLTSRTRHSFRRTWAHIRQDATDVTVMWFVKRGRLCVSNQNGSSVAKAGEILEKSGAVSASSFRNQARFFGSSAPIKPGEYKIEEGMGAGDILRLLQSGKTIQRLVMIPEGMPSIMVWDRLMAEKRLTGSIPSCHGLS